MAKMQYFSILLRRSHFRPRTLVTFLVLLGATSAAWAYQHFYRQEIAKHGEETGLQVELNAPFGAVMILPGTPPNTIVAAERNGPEDNDPELHIRYQINHHATGFLSIDVGTDEGSLLTPPIAMWRARSGFSVTSANVLSQDGGGAVFYGAKNPWSIRSSSFIPSSASSNAIAKIFLTKELPISMHAELGIGESSMDLTGLSLYFLSLETGASKTRIQLREPNPMPMKLCQVSAGVGECTLNGLSYLNTSHFIFNGGLGYYHLTFDGRLQRDMDASVSVALGKCSIDIPAASGRVRIFYDDGLFSSFTFNGLARHKNGYVTSVGFEQSNEPVLTLHLSSGMGKTEVNYH